jgi:uncharacterized protein (TIGR02118 family)
VPVIKLMLVFHMPHDLAGSESAWSRAFEPLVDDVRGIPRVAVSRVLEQPTGGADVYPRRESIFDDLDAARAAMARDAGRAAGRALMDFTAGSVTVSSAEHHEEIRPSDVEGGG